MVLLLKGTLVFQSFVRNIVILALLPSAALAQGAVIDQPRILDDIKFLSDDRLEGRMTGTPDADTAAFIF